MVNHHKREYEEVQKGGVEDDVGKASVVERVGGGEKVNGVEKVGVEKKGFKDKIELKRSK